MQDRQFKEQIELKTQGIPILVTIRNSLKAKNIAIRIKHQDVELVLPYGASRDRALQFLLSKEKVIREKLESKGHPLKEYSKIHNKLPILGDVYDIKYVNCANTLSVIAHNNLITVIAPKHNASDALVGYLQHFILNEINELVKKSAKKYGFRYGKISVKEMTSQWGSCSSAGDLSFNWRIIFAPTSVLHCLVTHELCHLKEKNHSERFWNLVGQICPDYKTSNLWLKKHGHTLYQYFFK